MGIRIGPPKDTEAPPESLGSTIFDEPNPYRGLTFRRDRDFRDRIAEEVETPEAPGYLDTIYDAIQAEQFLPNAGRWLGETPEEDTDWVLGEDDWKEFIYGPDPKDDGFVVPDEYRDLASRAVSKEHLMQLRETIREDFERESRLAAAGLPGLAARMGATLIDPVAIGISAGTVGAMGPFVGAWKATKVQRILGAALAGGTSNAAAEAALSTVNPHIGWEDIGLAFAAGNILSGSIGALRRNPLTQGEADTMHRAGSEHLRETVGAARNPEHRGSIGSAVSLIDEGDVQTPAFSKARLDVAARAGDADNPTLTSLGRTLLDDPVGSVSGEVVDVGVANKATRLVRSYEAQMYSVAEHNWQEWARQRRVRFWQAHQKRDEFFSEVSRAIEDPSFVSDPRVKAVAQEHQRIYADVLRKMKDAGVVGAENIMENANYFPKLLSPTRVMALTQRLRDWRDIIPGVREAIRVRNPDMDEALLTRFAEGYAARLMKAAHGMGDDFERIVNTGDETAIRALLDEMVIRGEDQNALVSALTRSPSKDAGTARLMKRSKIDYNLRTRVRYKDGTEGTFAVRDVFETNAETVFHRYTRAMMGRIALAETAWTNPRTGRVIMDGIKSEGDWQKALNMVKEDFAARGITKEDAQYQNAMRNLEYIYNHLTGRPLHEANTKPYARFLRRVRDFNVVRMMANMGINQMQETAQVIGTLGARAVFRGLPSLRWMIDEAGRQVPKDRVVRELLLFTGEGTDNLINRYSWRYTDEIVGERLGQFRNMEKLDTGLAMGKEVISRISLMRWITAYQKQITMSAISQRFADMAARGGVERMNHALGGRGASAGQKLAAFFKGKDLKRLRSIGLSDDDLRAIFREMGDKAEFRGGSKLHALNLERWDPTVRDKYLDAMAKWTNKMIQTNDISSAASWMTHPMAQSIFQFRSFVFNAWAKQTMYGLNHFDLRQAITWSMEVAAGVGTYLILQKPKSMVMEGDQRKKFEEERLTAKEIMLQGFARSTPASIAPMLADTLLAGIGGSPLFENARASGSASQILSADARMIASPFEDVVKLPGLLGQMATNDREPSQPEMRAIIRGLPFNNWLPLATFYQHMISDLPERTPRED